MSVKMFPTSLEEAAATTSSQTTAISTRTTGSRRCFPFTTSFSFSSSIESRISSVNTSSSFSMTSVTEHSQGCCSVCGEKAFYNFYGCLACDSCRTFFRRHVLQKRHLACDFNDTCSVNLQTRKECSKCRLKKCFEAGMRVELVAPNEQQRIRRGRSTDLDRLAVRTQVLMEAASYSSQERHSSARSHSNHSHSSDCGSRFQEQETLSVSCSNLSSTNISDPLFTPGHHQHIRSTTMNFLPSSYHDRTRSLPELSDQRTTITSPSSSNMPRSCSRDQSYHSSPSSPYNSLHYSAHHSSSKNCTPVNQVNHMNPLLPPPSPSFLCFHSGILSKVSRFLLPQRLSLSSFDSSRVVDPSIESVKRDPFLTSPSEQIRTHRSEQEYFSAMPDVPAHHLYHPRSPAFDMRHELAPGSSKISSTNPFNVSRLSPRQPTTTIREKAEQSFSKIDEKGNRISFVSSSAPSSVEDMMIRREKWFSSCPSLGNSSLSIPAEERGDAFSTQHLHSVYTYNSNDTDEEETTQIVDHDIVRESTPSPRLTHPEEHSPSHSDIYHSKIAHTSTSFLPANTATTSLVSSLIDLPLSMPGHINRRFHAKCRRPGFTTIVISNKDSRTGEVKESFEIQNLSSTERERIIEVINAVKRLELSPEESYDISRDERTWDYEKDREYSLSSGGGNINEGRESENTRGQNTDEDDLKTITPDMSYEDDDDIDCDFFLEKLLYLSAKKVIMVAQKLKPFPLLNETDQMTLLKGSIAEILFLKSAQVFDKKHNCWDLTCLNSQACSFIPQIIPLLVFRGSQLYDKYQDFIDSFGDSFLSDPILINLMCIVCFFNDRQGLTNKEMIRCEKNLYLKILEEYVRSKFHQNTTTNNSSRPNQDNAFSVLLHKFHELSIMKELYDNTSVDPDNINSLVKSCSGIISPGSSGHNALSIRTSYSVVSYPSNN